MYKPIKLVKGTEFSLVETDHGLFFKYDDAVEPIVRSGKHYQPQPVIELLSSEVDFAIEVDLNDKIQDGNSQDLFKVNGPRPTKVRKR